MKKLPSPVTGDIWSRDRHHAARSTLFLVLSVKGEHVHVCIIDGEWSHTGEICMLSTRVGKWEKLS